MKRILQFMADGSAGGGATVLLGLTQDLLKDHEVHVLVEAGSYVAGRAREMGATIHEGAFFGSVLAREPVETVSKAIRQTNPDIVHYHGGRALFFGREIAHPAAVYTVHGYHFLHRGLKDRLMGCFAERKSLRHIREIVFVCDYDRQLGIRAGLVPKGMKTRVVYNGVDLPDTPVKCPPDQLKHIAYLNRLVYQKDPLLAIEVMRLLAPEGFKLLLIGGGEMEADVRAASQGLGDAVQFIGSVPREEAMRLTSECGAMLMTSRWEGLPLAPLEAMAMGVPVVAPAVSGIPEIVDSGVNGVLVESRNPFDFARALRQVCDPGPKRDALTAAARQKVERVFSWKACLAGYRSVYADLAVS